MIKSFLVAVTFCLFSLPVAAQNSDSTTVIRLSEPVFQNEAEEVYGSKLSMKNARFSLSEAISNKVFSEEIIISGTIDKVCKKKGCFFILKDDESEARVSFIDYSFFVPTDSDGKNITAQGKLTLKELTPEEANHYAEDAGEEADFEESVKEYSFVATAVSIKKQ